MTRRPAGLGPALRRAGALAGILAFGALTACGGSFDRTPVAQAPTPVATPAAPSAVAGDAIGTGPVKVALVIPVTGQGAGVGASLRNAADLAMADFQNPDIQVLVRDDRGSPEGAREAAGRALADGAGIVLGPLFAPNVQAAAAVARPADKPVVAFSTDVSVAGRGVYLLSFLPQPEVDRVIDHAAAQGRRSFAVLIPESSYGNVVEAAVREAVARKGARLVALERYAPGTAALAVARLGGLVTGAAPQADALFVADTPDGLAGAAGALAAAGFDPRRVKPLGTGVWNDPRVFALPALQGGWFAAVDGAGFANFAQRYRARYGTDPARVASLAYDAVSLAAALSRQYGSQRFAESTLTNPSGFSGVDGTFRFRPEGTIDRALAVFEVRAGAATVTSPAPRTLPPSGT
jgi:branched-chain amino acid transport system substrate-binding protein